MSVYIGTFISKIEISVAVSLPSVKVRTAARLSAARKINLKQLLPNKLFQLCKNYLNKQKYAAKIYDIFFKLEISHQREITSGNYILLNEKSPKGNKNHFLDS